MLTVHEGELVEVMDISRNEWCLVQPSSRQSVEGWVPTAYLRPYDAGGYGKLVEHIMYVFVLCLWDINILTCESLAYYSSVRNVGKAYISK